jgi:hypothetical protein
MHGHAGGLQVRLDAGIEQQALQRRQLRLLDVELAGEAVDADLQRGRHGVTGAAGVLDTTDGGRLVEVELAAVELAHLHQALTERVQAGRLRLQLAQLERQGIQAALRIRAHAAEFGVLPADLLLQVVDLAQRAVARAGDGEGQRAAQGQAAQHAQRQHREQLPAHPPAGQIQGFRQLAGT